MSATLISRIAPTPSGFLHIGNALNFLLTWLLVRSQKGHLHLRIDDLDAARIKDSCLSDIFRQLEWLGISFDSGPSSPDELFSKYSQRFKIDAYQQNLLKLKDTNQLFVCECSRSFIRTHSNSKLYAGTCHHKNLDFNATEKPWRIKVGTNTKVNYLNWESNIRCRNLSENMGDFIVRRRDGLPGYQIASLIDDLELGVNLVVRGQDLLDSTVAQIYLAQRLDERVFPQIRFIHHSMKNDETGNKLSKSEGAYSLKMMREQHQNPSLIYQETANWLGLAPEKIQSLEDLFSSFQENFNLVSEKLKLAG